MLIKIDDEGTYINSDHIVIIGSAVSQLNPSPVIPFKTDFKRIWFFNGLTIDVSDAVAAYITQILDASDALTSEAPAAMSLQSRIALHLRNQSAGQSMEMLTAVFPATDKAVLEAALTELDANNVVRGLGDDDARLYYHASNPIFGSVSEF